MSTCALGTAEEVQSCQVNYILSSKTRAELVFGRLVLGDL